jgi:hypothetical protein
MKFEVTTAPPTSHQSARQQQHQDLPLSPKDQELYLQHRDAVARHWNPRTPFESFLVTRVACLDFLYSRAEALQFSLLDRQQRNVNENTRDDDNRSSLTFDTIDRHLARLSRQRNGFIELLQQQQQQQQASGQRPGRKNKNSTNEPDNGPNQAAA